MSYNHVQAEQAWDRRNAVLMRDFLEEEDRVYRREEALADEKEMHMQQLRSKEAITTEAVQESPWEADAQKALFLAYSQKDDAKLGAIIRASIDGYIEKLATQMAERTQID